MKLLGLVQCNSTEVVFIKTSTHTAVTIHMCCNLEIPFFRTLIKYLTP